MLNISTIQIISVFALYLCLLHPLQAFSNTPIEEGCLHFCEAKNINSQGVEFQYADLEKAKHFYKQAITMAAKEAKGSDFVYLSPSLNLAKIYLRQQKWDSVKIICDQVKDLIPKDLNPLETQIEHLNLEASYSQFNTNAEDAIDKFLEIIAIAEQNMEHEYADAWLMQTYNNLGNTYHDQGKNDKAIQAFEHALEHTPQGNERGIIFNNIGRVYNSLHLYEKAITYFERAKKIREEHNDMNGVLFSLAYTITSYEGLNKKKEALAKAQEAYQLAIAQEHLFFQIELSATIADLFISFDELKEAEQQLFLAQKIIAQNQIQGSPLFNYRKAEALLAFKQNKLQKAATLYNQLESDMRAMDNDGFLIDLAIQQFHVNNALGNKDATEHYFQLYDSLTIERLQTENTDKLAAIEADLVNAENENEILRLEKDKAVLAYQAQQNRTIAFSVGILALLAIIFYFNSRKKNKTINTQKEELELLNRTKDQIFAIIGHDLRKPALAFKGITKKVNYLLQKQDYQRLNVLGQAIENDAIALNQLTNNLLSWALTQKNIMPYKPNYFKLKDRVNEELLLFKQQINEKNISTHIDIADDLEVYADADAFSTIIRNLLDNAVKYTPEQGQINISSAVAKTGRVNIQIHDTGVGMSEEQLKNIFLLEKGKSSRGTQGEKGTGLGMHLVNELIKLNKAQIDVASAIGNGTRIELSFPNA